MWHDAESFTQIISLNPRNNRRVRGWGLSNLLVSQLVNGGAKIFFGLIPTALHHATFWLFGAIGI